MISFLRGLLINHGTPPILMVTQSKPIAPFSLKPGNFRRPQNVVATIAALDTDSGPPVHDSATASDYRPQTPAVNRLNPFRSSSFTKSVRLSGFCLADTLRGVRSFEDLRVQAW